MTRKSSQVWDRVLILLVGLCILPSVLGQTPRFRGLREFLPYTRKLPVVDKIELYQLRDKVVGQNEETKPATRVLKGIKAQKLASLWRRQTYNSHLSACHEPAYAIKFFYRGRLIAYASVCWSCNSIYMITPDLHRTQSFEGYNNNGEALSEMFRLAFEAGE